MRLSEKLAQIPLATEPLDPSANIPGPEIAPVPVAEPTAAISGEIPQQSAEATMPVPEIRDPEKAKRLRNDLGSVGLEFLFTPWNEAVLAVNGIMQARAMKGAEKAAKKADGLQLTGSVMGEGSLSAVQHRIPTPELTPVTRLENIHHKGAWAISERSRAAKHKRYIIGKVHSRTTALLDGTKVTPIPGSKLYFDTLKSTRMLASDRRSAKKAGKRYNNTGNILTRREIKLDKGVTGHDKAGRITSLRREYHTARARNANEFADKLVESAAERRNKMAAHEAQIQEREALRLLEEVERTRREAAARAATPAVELFDQDDSDSFK